MGLRASYRNGTGNTRPILTSPQLDTLVDPHEVEATAKRLLGIVNGALFLVQPVRIPLFPGGVIEQNSSGKFNQYILAEHFKGRSRVNASAIVVSVAGASPQHNRPPAVAWSEAAAKSDQLLSDVFVYLSGGPDWFNYYKAFELMRHDINTRLGGQDRHEQMGWPKKQTLNHFTLSAQVYRHAPPWDGDYTPEKAMPLDEATDFIHTLCHTWLKWRFP